jgi:hypothetical protein
MVLTSRGRLWPYEITSPIGAGGMGQVYRTHDTSPDCGVVASAGHPLRPRLDPREDAA